MQNFKEKISSHYVRYWWSHLVFLVLPYPLGSIYPINFVSSIVFSTLLMGNLFTILCLRNWTWRSYLELHIHQPHAKRTFSNGPATKPRPIIIVAFVLVVCKSSLVFPAEGLSINMFQSICFININSSFRNQLKKIGKIDENQGSVTDRSKI